MAWRNFQLLAASALVLLSACGGTTESELQEAVQADRDNAGSRTDGQQDDWYRVPRDLDESVRLASPATGLVLVHGLSGMNRQSVEALEGVGSCDRSCVKTARDDIMQLADEYALGLEDARSCIDGGAIEIGYEVPAGGLSASLDVSYGLPVVRGLPSWRF